MTTNLIEQAKAMAERLEQGELISVTPDHWLTLVRPGKPDMQVNAGGAETRRTLREATEAAALIRQLIAQIEGAKTPPQE